MAAARAKLSNRAISPPGGGIDLFWVKTAATTRRAVKQAAAAHVPGCLHQIILACFVWVSAAAGTPLKIFSIKSDGGSISFNTSEKARSKACFFFQQSLQLRIFRGHAQGLLDIRVVHFEKIGSIGPQDFSGFVFIHQTFNPFSLPNKISFNCALPLERRDMTVPMGNSKAAAISL